MFRDITFYGVWGQSCPVALVFGILRKFEFGKPDLRSLLPNFPNRTEKICRTDAITLVWIGDESFMVNELLPLFIKSRDTSPKSKVTRSLGSFLRITTRRLVSTKGPSRVSSARAHGRWAMGHGRADEAGPSLERDVEEASAGNGRALLSVPTFSKRRK